jgi:predicted amidohydrolase
LTVAVGQTSATGHGNLEANTAQVVQMIARGAAQGARVVLFPEEGVTGYYKSYIQNLTQQQLTAAEAQIAAACREHQVYAIVGIPHYANATHWYNTALVIDPSGEKIYRQAKMYRCCEPDGLPGKWLGTFEIDNVTCSVMICFDEFFPVSAHRCDYFCSPAALFHGTSRGGECQLREDLYCAGSSTAPRPGRFEGPLLPQLGSADRRRVRAFSPLRSEISPIVLHWLESRSWVP